MVLELAADDPGRPLLTDARDDALEFLMLSDFRLVTGAQAEPKVTAAETTDPECPRCRRSLALAGELCPRCAEVIAGLEATAS